MKIVWTRNRKDHLLCPPGYPKLHAWITRKRDIWHLTVLPNIPCKVIRPKTQKSKTTTRTMANNMKDEPEQTSKIVEFAGMATSKLIDSKIKSRQRQDENKSTSYYGMSRHTKYSLSNSEWDHKSSYQYHKNKLKNISTYGISNNHKVHFYHSLLRRARNIDLYPLLIHETRKLRKMTKYHYYGY